MTLQDLRRYAVRHRVRLHFYVEQAGECVVNEHGLLQIPLLAGTPRFQLDSSLAGVEQFTLAPVEESARRQRLSRQEMESMLAPAGKAEAAPED